MSMKGSCQFTVMGIDMKCPLCDMLVASGNRHECSTDGASETTPIESMPSGKKRGLDLIFHEVTREEKKPASRPRRLK